MTKSADLYLLTDFIGKIRTKFYHRIYRR